VTVGLDDRTGAVPGRGCGVESLSFPFDIDGCVRDCFKREGATRDIAPITGVEACNNNTQTYTLMCKEQF